MEERNDPSEHGRDLDAERAAEREEGILRERTDGSVDEGDRPQNEPPHPQDINDMRR